MKDVPTLKSVVESVWKKEDELHGLKAELVVMERKIEASLNPISNSVGISGNIPKEDTDKPFQMTEELRATKDRFEDKIIIARPSHGLPPDKKGFKI